ncbi:MAG TPA: PAS domain S-box protein, partial [Treponemataceae bacterium]|nr:PAS domain S-box protein [Treponemataceae bacterium]
MSKTNEEVFKEILEQSPAGYWDWDIPTGNSYLSPSFKQMFGYRDHELENHADSWQKIMFQEDLPAMIEQFNQHVSSKGKIPFYKEIRYNHKNGSTVWVICTGKVIEWDETGKAKRMVGSNINITDRVQAEENFKARNNLWSIITETSPVGIVTVDKAGTITYANKRAEEILGLVKNEITSLTYDAPLWNHINLDGSPLVDEKQPFNIVKTTMRTAYGIQHGIIWPDGTVVFLSINASPMKDTHNEFDGMLATIEDITNRKKAEDKLKESEEKYRAAFITSPDSVNINRMDGLYVDINEGFTNITGYTSKDVIGKLSSEIDIWAIPEDRTKLILGLTTNGSVENLESVFRCKDGSLKTALMSARVITVNNEPHILSVTRDISDRKKAEQTIAAEKERLAVTLRSIGDGVITTDINGNIVMMNKVAEDLTGWKQDEAQGKSLTSVFTIIQEITRNSCENPVERVISTGSVIELANHTVLISRDGTERIIADSGAPIKDKSGSIIGVVLVFRDMTEKQKFLEITQNSQKL